MENLENLCVSYVEPILTIGYDASLVQTINKLNKVTQQMDIPYPQIIASTEYEMNKSRFMLTGHKDWIHSLAHKLEQNGFYVSKEIQIGLYISGYGLGSSTYEQTIFEMLETQNIKVLKYMRDAKGLLLVTSLSEKNLLTNFADSLI